MSPSASAGIHMRGASQRPVSVRLCFGCLLLLLSLGRPERVAADAAMPTSRSEQTQIRELRSKIHTLEIRLDRIRQQAESLRKEQEELDLGIELAEARVEEISLLLMHSRDEIIRLKTEAAELSKELQARRRILAINVQLAALLGKPGPLQLMWDALRGGHLEEATATVLVLTRGQAVLVREYGKLRDERAGRLADLSRQLEKAGQEARELQSRRARLDEIRARAAEKLRRLEKQQQNTGGELAELRQREAALERLFTRVSRTRRFTGRENVLSYRGALPWPARGKVVLGFGRHYLRKYATYTLCNGLRMKVETGEEIRAIFSGVVAFARYFKGYGNMVVVDHGHEIYSMIAGFSSIHVRVNQKVALGERLGIAGSVKDDGNVYLEIRVGAKAEDPRRWLQLKQGR